MKQNRIRPIAICLFRNGDHILAAEGFDSVKQTQFYRPLGGGVEFGEHSRDALAREIKEELGAEIEDARLLGVIENVFTLEGRPGHEVVFVYDARFTDKSLYERETLIGREDGAGFFTARWVSLAEVQNNGVRLVPNELIGLIHSMRFHEADVDLS